MNLLQQALYSAPSIRTAYCVFCGRPATNQHHVVPRSQGGTDGATLSVCGLGNASGCHGKLHSHKLHVRYQDGWQYLETKQPTKYQDALSMDGWRNIEGMD